MDRFGETLQKNLDQRDEGGKSAGPPLFSPKIPKNPSAWEYFPYTALIAVKAYLLPACFASFLSLLRKFAHLEMRYYLLILFP